MKRLVILALAFAAVFHLSISVYAKEIVTVGENSSEHDWDKEYSKVLPEGDNGVDGVVNLIKNSFRSLFTFGLNKFSSLASLLLLFGLFSSFVRSGYASDACNFAFFSAVCLYSVKSGLIDITLASSSVGRLSEICNALIPIEASLLLSGQKVSSAAFSGYSAKVVITLVQYLFKNISIPLITVSLALTCISSVSTESGRLASFLRKSAAVMTVSAVSICGFFLTLRSCLSSAADSVVLRSVKFAVGSFVPMVGGALSEAVGYVVNGFSYIKSTCGIMAVCALLAAVLPSIIKTAVSYTVFAALGAFSDIVCSQMTSLISALCSVSACLLACEISSAVLFVLRIVLFIRI